MAQTYALSFAKEVDTVASGNNDNGPVFDTLFQQYEQVVVKSLITSFGLDLFLGHDQRGGDVDTINTVRDSSVGYKDKKNEADYNNRGEYNPDTYHKHEDYIAKNRAVNDQKKSGNLQDAYTGKKLSINEKVDLDHTISAKEIHDDPGRVLAGVAGEELANRDSNLNATNSSVNRSKKAKNADEFLQKLEEDKSKSQVRINELKNKKDLTDEERKELSKLENLDAVNPDQVKERDNQARKAYEAEIATRYYTSPKFLKATAKASLKKGGQMGLRQCLGFILTEAWFSVKEDLPAIANNMKDDFDLGVFFKEIAESIKRAFANVKEKYKELIAAFKDGILAGILASISSTLMNIFFTTAKNVGKILRESWASIVEAVKILVYNPDDLPFGEMLRTVAKIIATCVSVICGSLVQEALSKLVTIPVLSEVVPIFVGSMVTGIMTVSILYFIDHSKAVQKIVEFANSMRNEFDLKLEYYKAVTKRLNEYVAELMSIDLDKFEKEVEEVHQFNIKLYEANSNEEINAVLHAIMNKCKIIMPYETMEELDNFMNDKDSVLII